MRTTDRPARRPTLFAQIAVRLVAVTVLFTIANAALVVADYFGDRQVLADDFIAHQATRVERASREARLGREGGTAIPAPPGVTDWGFAVVDASGQVAFQGGDTALLAEAAWPRPGVLDSTQRQRTPDGVRITGVRRFDGAAEAYWVVIVAEAADWRVYVPVIGGELVDHVVLPLIPLTALLLLFNVLMVRRMLAPLAMAAAAVDRLDASAMDARIGEPGGSREVAVLVAAIDRALDRVQAAMRMLRSFTEDAAHELRTPLSVMQLRVDELPPGEARTRLRGDVAAMTRLVNQMLDLSQADVLSLEGAEPVDLTSLGQEVVGQMAPIAFQAGRDLRLLHREPTPVLGRRDALGRVLRNLIENAIRHGGSPVEVTVGPGPRFSVRDHGPGLQGAKPELLFQRFWRGRRDVTDGGAGLGLGITRSIVEAHGGHVTAEDAQGGGALFSCVFPGA